MGDTPRNGKHQDLTRLTLSVGKRTEPRLVMATPIGERKTGVRRTIIILAVICAVAAIWLAGRSL